MDLNNAFSIEVYCLQCFSIDFVNYLEFMKSVYQIDQMNVQFMGFAEGHTLKGVSEGNDKTVHERKQLQIVWFGLCPPYLCYRVKKFVE